MLCRFSLLAEQASLGYCMFCKNVRYRSYAESLLYRITLYCTNRSIEQHYEVAGLTFFTAEFVEFLQLMLFVVFHVCNSSPFYLRLARMTKRVPLAAS